MENKVSYFDGSGSTIVVAKKIGENWCYWNTRKRKFFDQLSKATLYPRKKYAMDILTDRIYSKYTEGAEIKYVHYDFRFIL